MQSETEIVHAGTKPVAWERGGMEGEWEDGPLETKPPEFAGIVGTTAA